MKTDNQQKESNLYYILSMVVMAMFLIGLCVIRFFSLDTQDQELIRGWEAFYRVVCVFTGSYLAVLTASSIFSRDPYRMFQGVLCVGIYAVSISALNIMEGEELWQLVRDHYVIYVPVIAGISALIFYTVKNIPKIYKSLYYFFRDNIFRVAKTRPIFASLFTLLCNFIVLFMTGYLKRHNPFSYFEIRYYIPCILVSAIYFSYSWKGSLSAFLEGKKKENIIFNIFFTIALVTEGILFVQKDSLSLNQFDYRAFGVSCIFIVGAVFLYLSNILVTHKRAKFCTAMILFLFPVSVSVILMIVPKAEQWKETLFTDVQYSLVMLVLIFLISVIVSSIIYKPELINSLKHGTFEREEKVFVFCEVLTVLTCLSLIAALSDLKFDHEYNWENQLGGFIIWFFGVFIIMSLFTLLICAALVLTLNYRRSGAGQNISSFEICSILITILSFAFMPFFLHLAQPESDISDFTVARIYNLSGNVESGTEFFLAVIASVAASAMTVTCFWKAIGYVIRDNSKKGEIIEMWQNSILNIMKSVSETVYYITKVPDFFSILFGLYLDDCVEPEFLLDDVSNKKSEN